MRTDLHIHTIFSDGKFTPEEIAALAKERGVEFLSMTDHDSLEGAEEKRAAAERHGLKYVSGWEVSAYAEIGKVHVLGYRCQTNGAYFSFLKERIEGAIVRAEDIIKKANAYLGLNLTIEDAEREHLKKEAPLHTMHVVRAYQKALNADLGELYNSVFAQGKPAYSDLCRPTPFDALSAIHAAGGLAVLAHPGRIEGGCALVDLMEELCRAGLDGLECTYTTHTAEQTEYFQSFAKKHGLLQTGGSDFHYPDGGRTEIGMPLFEADGELLRKLL